MSSASKNAKTSHLSPQRSTTTNKADEGRDSMLHEKKRMNRILKGTIGYATDIKRDLHAKGAVNDHGELLVDVFRAKLASGEIDMEPYKEALK
jgi:hypothetical protein